MQEIQRETVIHLLYELHVDEVMKELETITDTDVLYVYLFNYNWDNGFEIPNAVLNHSSCDLSVALMTFYHADGDVFLGNRNVNQKLQNWSVLIQMLYSSIIGGKYKKNDIKFVFPLSKVQLFKLKKILSFDENVFIEEFGTRNLDVII